MSFYTLTYKAPSHRMIKLPPTQLQILFWDNNEKLYKPDHVKTRILEIPQRARLRLVYYCWKIHNAHFDV